MMLLLAVAAAASPLWVGRFSGEGAPPAPWRVVLLNKKVPATVYRGARVAGVGAIEARANKSMALLARPLRVDLARTPVLCWRWLVDAPVAKADMRTKRGDDYAARIYVSFDIPDDKLSAGTRLKLSLGRRMFGGNLPDAALNYVWDNKHAVGTRARSAYTDRAELIVAETGAARAGKWVGERADIAADFARAFGGVPGSVTQLALASDTDNSGGSARAAFADLHFVARDQRCAF
ncbi:MAG TPA: DUF3047 domain-containing protein [Allosphingosinicella sp.]|jgi:hypothetical protein|uniref:DUF3047 domain-containing protein n=1 Tax=Allosphingosinicella sp. TaxID=2823234 RepID=UPI002F278207